MTKLKANGRLDRRTRKYHQYLEERFSFWTMITLLVIFVGIYLLAENLK